MFDVLKQFGGAIVAAIIGGAVTVLTLTSSWFWSSLSDKFWYELSSNVIGRMEFQISASPATKQHVDWRCPEGTQLVSASCTATDPDLQVAIGPTYHADRSFSCDRYGPTVNAVQGTAICFKVRR